MDQMLKELNKLDQKESYDFLKKNKADLIAEKKASLKFTESLVHSVDVKTIPAQKKSSLKSDGNSSEDTGRIDVTVVCNTAWFCDSYMDVLTDTSYDASIAKRGTTIPHIADHNHTSTAHVGDVKAIYTKKLRCKDLGYNSEAETTALVMETTIREDYNSDVYTFYKAGKINQHSIGLSYVTIELALNSQVEEDKAEYEVWQKYYPSIINKDLVDKKGYFWAVSEADIRENSCVLFGANALTPTLSSSEKSDKFDLPAKTEIFSKTKGADMATIEELQAEVIRLSAENTNLKSANTLEIKKAVKEEQERILGIMKAAETFEIKGSIEKFIKLNHDVDTCVATFETIKEHTQLANPSPKQEQGSTLDKSNTPDLSQKSGLDGILEGFKNIESAQNLFAGIK